MNDYAKLAEAYAAGETTVDFEHETHDLRYPSDPDIRASILERLQELAKEATRKAENK